MHPRRPQPIALVTAATAIVVMTVILVISARSPAPTPSPSAVPESPAPGSGTPVLPSDGSQPTPALSGSEAPPPPPDEGTPEPCGTFDPRCNKMPVDGAGVVFTPDLPCGELGTCRLSMGIAHPRSGGPWPVVVVEPGGPRPPGADQYLGDFAGLIASQGAVVFVAGYREGPQWGGGYPTTYQDIACAVRFARENAARWAGDGSRVTLVAHSLGPFFASVVALSPDAFEPPPGTCLATKGSTKPDAFVGVAGVYSSDDISAEYLNGFFGGTRADAPAAWAAGDPYAIVAAKSRLDVPVRLIHGSMDTNVVPSSSQRFEQALEAAGYDAQLTIVPTTDHTGVLQDHHTIEVIAAIAHGPGG